MLPDLHEIVEKTKLDVERHTMIERTVPPEFIEQYSTLLRKQKATDIVWNEYTLQFKTKEKLSIVCPNQWFFLAIIANPFLEALKSYKTACDKIFAKKLGKKNYKLFAELARGDEDKGLAPSISDEHLEFIEDHFEDEPGDATRMVAWLTDYKLWHGSKSIERPDFFHSAVNTILRIVHADQGYVSKIAKLFYENSTLPQVLILEGQHNPQPIVEPAFDDILPGNNTIIYGAPGTGKSYRANSKSNRSPIIRTVFHADTSYQDFIGSYRPCKINGEFSYEFTPGPFVNAIVLAQNNPHEMFTLLIEEINRANAGAVFGEMFQLLDRDASGKSEYQITPESALAEHLKEYTPQMGESLWIPANLNIIATMNSADQGVFPMDSAFKRRWNFEYLPIDFTKAQHSETVLAYAGKHVTWENFACTINKQLASHHVNEDRHLGPFFIKPDEIKGNGNLASKVLIYLWDDVVRHQRRILFKDNYKTFNEVIKAFEKGEDVFSAWDEPIANYLIDKDDPDHAD